MSKANHMPWENGVFSDYQAIIKQKTIKTQCGKQVSIKSANHLSVIDCPSCRRKMQNEVTAWKGLLSSYQGRTDKDEVLKENVVIAIREVEKILSRSQS